MKHCLVFLHAVGFADSIDSGAVALRYFFQTLSALNLVFDNLGSRFPVSAVFLGSSLRLLFA